jgi:D-3-phosphoglycerate dehydrogenase / 2-oxoglutarate reductase
MTILLLETIEKDALEVLESVESVMLSPTPDALSHNLPFSEFSAIVTRGVGRIDATLMEKCPNLKAIARCGAGLNNLDLETAGQKEIPVVFAPGINAVAVAEHTLMLILMAVRDGFQSGVQAQNGNWSYRDTFKGDDISGKKICIVGGGNIGGRVADLCRAFSMDVVICGRNGKGIDGLRHSLRQQFPSADIVSLHIPLTDQTHHIVDRDLLEGCKPQTTLVNTARGELVSTSAVIEALDQGQLKSYACDVLENEPPQPDDPLLLHPGTIVTPHAAALTTSTYRELCMFTARNVAAVLMNKSPDQYSIYAGSV